MCPGRRIKSCASRLKHQEFGSQLFSSLGGANCLQSLEFAHGSKDGLCRGCGAGGLDCLSSFSLSINPFKYINKAIRKAD